MGRKMSLDLKDSVRAVLEFYKAMGFERLPLNYSNELSEMGNEPEDRNALGVMRNELKEDNASRITDYGSKEAALRELRDEIGDCQRCKLSAGRQNIVFGEGNPDSPLMFIGEAPGREEDNQGRPFVGEAGQILTSLINKMGEVSGFNFKRADVYIANVVKCRPSMNRDPQEDEIRECFPFLQRQIEIVSPKVIMALGRISAHTLSGDKEPISKYFITKRRGKFFDYNGIPIMPTFHPAYFLRNPKDKPLTWSDAQAVLKKLQKGGEGKDEDIVGAVEA
jgi:DNA polymerase